MNRLKKNWRRFVEGFAILGLIGLAFEGIKYLASETAFGIFAILTLIAVVCYLLGFLVED